MDIHFRVWHIPEKKMYYRGYQKMTHVLLCKEGGAEEEGIPELKASYDDCEFMQGTGILDRVGQEIFEGDIVCIQVRDKTIRGVVEGVPDMYKSRNLHPLHSLLSQNNINDDEEGMVFEILGNRYQNSEML